MIKIYFLSEIELKSYRDDGKIKESPVQEIIRVQYPVNNDTTVMKSLRIPTAP